MISYISFNISSAFRANSVPKFTLSSTYPFVASRASLAANDQASARVTISEVSLGLVGLAREVERLFIAATACLNRGCLARMGYSGSRWLSSCRRSNIRHVVHFSLARRADK
ncbi:hypothetical protein ACKS0A_02415 [Histoplasma ohiense]